MSILSDDTLKAAVAAGQLIEGGDTRFVKYCAYQFTAEKVVPPGSAVETIDWSVPGSDSHYVIEPGAIVWVRTRGRVKMPSDKCGFYWQTNSLARRGLMLVNSSMVEPGYEGPLACLFVNFGKQPIPIYPDTVVARLIVMQLDKMAGDPLRDIRTAGDYDRSLKDAAVVAPRSFLQVAEMAFSLQQEKENAIKEISKAANDERATVQREAEAERERLKKDLADDFAGTVKNVFWRWAAVMALIFLGINVFSWVQSRLRPSVERDLQERVATEVRGRVQGEIGATVARRDSVDVATDVNIRRLRSTVDSLQQRIQVLEREGP